MCFIAVFEVLLPRTNNRIGHELYMKLFLQVSIAVVVEIVASKQVVHSRNKWE